MEQSVTSFSNLPFDEQKKILLAMTAACAEQWGEECMPAADIGDNNVYSMNEIAEWISGLTG